MSIAKFFNTIIFTCLLTNTILAQEYIPLKEVYSETVKGDIKIIGNSILGIKGIYDSIVYKNNDAYNGELNNGRQFNKEAHVKDQSGNLLYLDSENNITTEATTGNGDTNKPFFNLVESSYSRVYYDIDSDKNFEENFSSNLNASERDYGGEVDINGALITYSKNGTFSSSAAFLDLDNECINIKKAILYWSGIYPGKTSNSEIIYDSTNKQFKRNLIGSPRSNFCGGDCEDYTEIKILPPFGEKYYTITADTIANPDLSGLNFQTEVIVDGIRGSYYNNQIFGTNGPQISDSPYVCKADITKLFNSLQKNIKDISGYWTVANIISTTGTRIGSGLAGGWTLAVVYETNDSSATSKFISFYDGFSTIRSGRDPIQLTVPNFKVPPGGPIRAWIANAAIEGDRAFDNDQFSIKTKTTILNNPSSDNSPLSSAIPLREQVIDNRLNFFNSTITDLNGNLKRLPNSLNTLGYDTDHFELTNTNNSVLNNDSFGNGAVDDTATLYLSTTGDTYSSFFTAFAIETIQPDVEFTIKVRNINTGNQLVNYETVDFGQELIYEVTIRNNGNDIAENILFENYLPANVNLISNKSEIANSITGLGATTPRPNIEISSETITDSSGISYDTQKIEIAIPDLGSFNCINQPIDPINGIRITDPACGNEILFEFRVSVVDECSNNRNSLINEIQNFPYVSYSGLFNTNRVDRAIETFFENNECTNSTNNPALKLSPFGQDCDILSVNESSLDKTKFNVHPNPTRGLIYIGEEIDNIKLVSVFGITLKTLKNASKINIADYPSGVYFLIFEKNDQITVERIVKI